MDSDELASAALWEEEDGSSGFVSGSLSFDALRFEDDCRVSFEFSHRDWSSGTVLSRFHTALHVAVPAAPLLTGSFAAALACGMLSLFWLYVGLPTQRVLVSSSLALSNEQLRYWTETLRAMLGEFAAEHSLDMSLFRVEESCFDRSQSARPPETGPARAAPSPPRLRCLVPLGGGKDSSLVWALLRAVPDTELCWFYLSETPDGFDANWRLEALRRVSGDASRGGGAVLAPPPVLIAWHHWRCPRWEAVRDRRFTPMGHPWAALCAFSAALAATLHGWDDIAAGNERSAGEGNGVFEAGGKEVNHQHDKSLAWELEAAAYIRSHIRTDLRYWSALSHLWEVQVAARFAALPRDAYLPLILSCNDAASAPDPANQFRHCGVCAKCLFLALLLCAFLPHPSHAWAVFGDDILARNAALPLIAALCGRPGTTKPMECVGTAAETRYALHRARASYAQAGLPFPVALRGEDAEADARSGAQLEDELMGGCGPHAVPRWAQAALGADPALYCGVSD